MKRLLTTIKEISTAHYDNGVIKNCRYGSFSYWHEYRHKLQMDIVGLKVIWTWMPYVTAVLGMSVWWLIYLLKLPELYKIGCWVLFPISAFVFFIEVDANIYAFYKILKQNGTLFYLKSKLSNLIIKLK